VVGNDDVVGDDGKVKLSDEPELKGTPKFAILLASRDAQLLQDDLYARARFLSYSTDATVFGINGSPNNWLAIVLVLVRDRDREGFK
jgi:hypothetical protein